MSFHDEATGVDIHVIHANTYADLTARDADTDWNTDTANVGKVVKVEAGPTYYILLLITPTWLEITTSVSNSLAGALAVGNTTGGSNIVVEAGDAITLADNTPIIFGGGEFQINYTGFDIELTSSLGDIILEAAVEGDLVMKLGAQDLNSQFVIKDPTDANLLEMLGDGRIGIGGNPELTTLLKLTSTTRGFLVPRMTTTQRDAIVSPETGLEIFNITANEHQFFNSIAWQSMVNDLILNSIEFTDGSAQFIGAAPLDINWYVDTATQLNTNSLSAEITTVRGLFISINGLKLYVSDLTTQTAYEYDLAAPWDTTIAPSYTGNSLLTSLNTTAFFLRNDGTSAYFMTFGGSFREYPLSTPFDLSTAGTLIAHPNTEGSVNGVCVLASGLDVFFASSTGVITHWTMEQWDFSTLVDTGESFATGISMSSGGTINFRLDGRRAFVVGNTSAVVTEYSLDVPFDITTMRLGDTTATTINPSELQVNPQGDKFFIMFSSGANVTEFSMGLRTSTLSADLIGVGTGTPDLSSVLEVVSTVRGILTPRMTETQRDAIASPATGLELYNLTTRAKNAYNGASWLGTSQISAFTIEIFQASDLDDIAVAGVITITVPTEIIIKSEADIVTATRFVVEATGRLFIRSTMNIIYIGTGTWITVVDASPSTLGSGGIVLDNFIVIGNPAATLFDIDGANFIVATLVLFIGFGALGTANNCGDTSFSRCAFVNSGSTLFFTNMINEVTIDFSVKVAIGAPSINAPIFEFIACTNIVISKCGSELLAGESFLRVDPSSDFQLIASENNIRNGPLFDVSGGSTGTFASIDDETVSATTITSVTDSSGVARFNFTVGPTMQVFQEAVISGFVTNTAYNITGIITAAGIGFFEISSIDFGSDETGSFRSDSVRIQSVGHGLGNGQTLVIDSDFTTDYDGEGTTYQAATNNFRLNRTFIATESGSWDTSGLDQSDPRMLAFNNPGFVDSKYLATAFVNDNTTANGAIVNNTFTDMVFGTGGDALVAATTIERWKLIDELNGTFEYTGDEPFAGLITFDFTVTSSGGAVDFRFRWEIDTGSGFGVLPDNVEALVNVGSDSASVTKTFPLAAVKGDQIKPQITRDSGTSGITTMYASILATQ